MEPKKDPKTGKWFFVVDVGTDPATGKRKQARRKGFATKKEASEEMRKLLNDVGKGKFIPKQTQSPTFENFGLRWLEWYAATAGVKEGTIIGRRKSYQRASKMIGLIKIKDFNRQVYDKFLLELDKKYAAETLRDTHVTVKMILDYAVDCRLLKENPAKFCKKPKHQLVLEEVHEDVEELYLTRNECDQLLNAAKIYGDLQYFVIIRLLLYSGMRIGEVLALEFKHIDFEKKIIKIRQGIFPNRPIHDILLQTPKTTSSIRDIEIDPVTLNFLRQMVTEQKKKRLKAGDDWYSDGDFLFTSSQNPGYPLPYVTIRYAFTRILKQANIHKRITLHSLRHTHASLLAESGATLEQIQARLGHSSDNVTKRIYLHITKDSQHSMMKNFATFMDIGT